MAARYLRATGNWNGAVWADTSSGVAGSAATPTAVDSVFIAANFTVTLTANAECFSLTHTNGILSLSSYNLTVPTFTSSGSTARTINMGSGILTVRLEPFVGSGIDLSGTNLTLDAGTSLLVINHLASAGSNTFGTLSKTFNDVRINLGSASYSVTLNITGSATFNLLEIRSANSAAHTVNFHADLYAYRFISIGSSTTNRILLDSITGTEGLLLADTENATLYAQNSNFSIAYIYSALTFDATVQPVYVGSNSISGADGNILESDPPKISTLIDPLTVAPGSNSNWSAATYSGAGLPSLVTTGISGGGYSFTSKKGIISTGTFDMVDSEFIIEVPSYTDTTVSGFSMLIGWADPTGAITGNGPIFGFEAGIGLIFNPLNNKINDTVLLRNGGGSSGLGLTTPFSTAKYIKLSVSSSDSKCRFSYSSNGVSWSTPSVNSLTLNDATMNILRASRIYMTNYYNSTSTGQTTIGSVNILPKPLNTGAFLQLF